MPFFWKKEKQIIAKIEMYLQEIDICRDRFYKCISRFIQQTKFNPNKSDVEAVHQSESKADDIRRDIEYELYNKALIPESREDILNLLEGLDSIPNSFEEICFQISIQKILFPKELKRGLLQLTDKSIEAYNLVHNAMQGLFYKKQDIMDEIINIDRFESQVDVIERELIKKVFDSSNDLAEKIIFKEVIKNIASISDLAQNLSDKLSLAIVKRRI